jgi:hypothetical protein
VRWEDTTPRSWREPVLRRVMMFVPSIGGRSHSLEEWTSPEDMATGVSVLTESLKRPGLLRGSTAFFGRAATLGAELP